MPEGPLSNDEKFFQRLEMHGAPWCIDLPKEALGGLWVAKPSEMMSPEGFPSEVRVLLMCGSWLRRSSLAWVQL